LQFLASRPGFLALDKGFVGILWLNPEIQEIQKKTEKIEKIGLGRLLGGSGGVGFRAPQKFVKKKSVRPKVDIFFEIWTNGPGKHPAIFEKKKRRLGVDFMGLIVSGFWGGGQSGPRTSRGHFDGKPRD